MIHLTRLNRAPLVVNSDLIEHIEITPDTLIVLTTGQKIIVRETADEVVERVIGFRRALLAGMPAHALAGCPQCSARALGRAPACPAESPVGVEANLA